MVYKASPGQPGKILPQKIKIKVKILRWADIWMDEWTDTRTGRKKQTSSREQIETLLILNTVINH